jgi:hypothetical protein
MTYNEYLMILENNPHISINEILENITDIELEIKGYEVERLKHPKLETTYNSMIRERRTFIHKLKNLIKIRE